MDTKNSHFIKEQSRILRYNKYNLKILDGSWLKAWNVVHYVECVM